MSQNQKNEIMRTEGKDQMIRRIHLFGKIGQILSVIAMAVQVFVILLSLLMLIFVFTMPKDFLKIHFNDQMEASLDFSSASEDRGLPDALREFAEDLSSGTARLKINNYVIEQGSFESGILTLEGGSEQTVVFVKGRLILLIVMLIVNILAFLLTTYFIFRFTGKLKSLESPFDPMLIRDLRLITISLVPWYFLELLSQGVYEYFMSGSFNIMFNIDIKLLVVILFLLLISLIFRYGALLQEESDDTV